MGILRRDQALQDASGRWVIGQPDPIDFVPGDIAAIRKIVGGTTILKDTLLAQIKHAWPSAAGEVALTRAAADIMLIELTTAIPYFIPATASGAVLLSHPPAPALLDRLRLPFPHVLVIFGTDLELDPATHPWPQSLRHATSSTSFDLVHGMITRGGYLTGMVLLADQDGRPRREGRGLVRAVASHPRRLRRRRCARSGPGWRRSASRGASRRPDLPAMAKGRQTQHLPCP
jgi:hypothetical protein